MIRRYLARRGNDPVVVTTALMRRWHTRLNKAVFDGLLRKCTLSFGDSRCSRVEGLCFALPCFMVHIHVDEKVDTIRRLVDVMAHEMIHQEQHQANLPMAHKTYFKARKRDIDKQLGTNV